MTEIVGEGVTMTTLEMIMGFPPPRLHFISALHGGTCDKRKECFAQHHGGHAASHTHVKPAHVRRIVAPHRKRKDHAILCIRGRSVDESSVQALGNKQYAASDTHPHDFCKR